MTDLGITSTTNNSYQIKVFQAETLFGRMLNNNISMVSSNSVISFIISWFMATAIIGTGPSARTNGCNRFSYWYFRSSFELTLEFIPPTSISTINGLKHCSNNQDFVLLWFWAEFYLIFAIAWFARIRYTATKRMDINIFLVHWCNS